MRRQINKLSPVAARAMRRGWNRTEPSPEPSTVRPAEQKPALVSVKPALRPVEASADR
jgi:hypothetical protein